MSRVEEALKRALEPSVAVAPRRARPVELTSPLDQFSGEGSSPTHAADASEPQTDLLERPSGRIKSVSPLFDIPRWVRPTPNPPPRTIFRQKPPRRVPVAPSLLVHRDVPLIGRDQAIGL